VLLLRSAQDIQHCVEVAARMEIPGMPYTDQQFPHEILVTGGSAVISTVAPVLAKGVLFARTTGDAMHKFDEEHGISAGAKSAAQKISSKATEFDREHKISETTAAAGRQVGEAISNAAAEVDAKLKIRETASAAAAAVSNSPAVKQAQAVAHEALASKPVVAVSSFFSRLASSVVSAASEVKAETLKHVPPAPAAAASSSGVSASAAVAPPSSPSTIIMTGPPPSASPASSAALSSSAH